MSDNVTNDNVTNDNVTSKVHWAQSADDTSVADHIAAILTRPGPKRLAVPGGSTPIPIFADLSARELDWRGAQLMLTDDRQVPIDHPASNQAKLEAAFANSDAAIHPLSPGMATQPFDLVWIGMGADGHFASIFPEMDADADALSGPPQVVETTPQPLPAEAPFARLSLNMAAITASDEIMLVVRGAAKREVLEAAIAGDNDLPIARLLKQASCPVTIFWSAS